jgi:hypothetical protein
MIVTNGSKLIEQESIATSHGMVNTALRLTGTSHAWTTTDAGAATIMQIGTMTASTSAYIWDTTKTSNPNWEHR